MSRNAVGSSRRTTSGSCAKALAIRTLCRSPPLRLSMLRSASGRVSVISIALRVISRSLSPSNLSIPR
ncbi:MAG: hypothetical protein PHY29_00820 [Syntrophales bacterium]|nr:hypothetical protein [Syntrophales bacterium]